MEDFFRKILKAREKNKHKKINECEKERMKPRKRSISEIQHEKLFQVAIASKIFHRLQISFSFLKFACFIDENLK